MRSSLAGAVLLAGCLHGGGDAPPGPTLPPAEDPVPVEAVRGASAPATVPDFCGGLYSGIAIVDGRAGIYGTHGDGGEPFHAFVGPSISDARELLASLEGYFMIWSTPDLRPNGIGRAYHRLRQAPDPAAQFRWVAEHADHAAGKVFAACGLAEHDAAAAQRVIAELRSSHEEIDIQLGCLIEPVPLADLVADDTPSRVYPSPGGFVVEAHGDDWGAEDPGRVQIVQSIEPFAPTDDTSMRAVATRRLFAVLADTHALEAWVPHDEVFANHAWRAHVEVRGDELYVQLRIPTRQRFAQCANIERCAVRFTIDAATGEARDVREVTW